MTHETTYSELYAEIRDKLTQRCRRPPRILFYKFETLDIGDFDDDGERCAPWVIRAPDLEAPLTNSQTIVRLGFGSVRMDSPSWMDLLQWANDNRNFWPTPAVYLDIAHQDSYSIHLALVDPT